MWARSVEGVRSSTLLGVTDEPFWVAREVVSSLPAWPLRQLLS
jgi:hypothetical protein